MRGRLHFTIGLPRSGKSTFAKKWMKEQPGRVVVNADSIRLNLYGQRYCGVGEPFVHAVKDVMINSLLDYGHDVLVDGTHTTQVSVEKLLSIDNNAVGIVFNVGTKTCKQRAIDSGKEDLLPVIDRMAGQLEHLPNLIGIIPTVRWIDDNDSNI